MIRRFVVSIGALACLLPFACRDALVAERCTNIPPGGCPKKINVNVCVDPSCDAVYACNPDQTWTLEYTCTARDGGARDAASRIVDAPSIRDVTIDAPPGANGGPGCTTLQPPDCALGVVLACAPGSCCGCEDLFVCENGGWKWWGVCDRGNPTQSDQ